MSNSFIKLLKKYTTIDKKFIDTFFIKFKIGGELHFDIKDIDVTKYLNIKIDTLRNRLQNKLELFVKKFKCYTYIREKYE
jgi:hypothetical protein